MTDAGGSSGRRDVWNHGCARMVGAAAHRMRLILVFGVMNRVGRELAWPASDALCPDLLSLACRRCACSVSSYLDEALKKGLSDLQGRPIFCGQRPRRPCRGDRTRSSPCLRADSAAAKHGVRVQVRGHQFGRWWHPNGLRLRREARGFRCKRPGRCGVVWAQSCCSATPRLRVTIFCLFGFPVLAVFSSYTYTQFYVRGGFHRHEPRCQWYLCNFRLARVLWPAAQRLASVVWVLSRPGHLPSLTCCGTPGQSPVWRTEGLSRGHDSAVGRSHGAPQSGGPEGHHEAAPAARGWPGREGHQ